MKYPLIAAVSMTLAACGGGGSSTASAPMEFDGTPMTAVSTQDAAAAPKMHADPRIANDAPANAAAVQPGKATAAALYQSYFD